MKMRTRNLPVLALIPLLLFSVLGHIDAAPPAPPSLQLSVEPMAPKILADAGKYYAIIQLQTEDGKPAQAQSDTNIDVLSSDPSIISVDPKVTLKEGQTMVKVDLQATKKTGTVSISALTTGVKAGKAKIDTVSREKLDPTTLVVYAMPSRILAQPNLTGKLYIQMLNSLSLPAAATAPVELALTSENNDIVSVPSRATIPQGKTGTFVDYTPGILEGTVAVTASASGLSPSSASVFVGGSVASKLVVEIAPDTIPSENGAEAIITVQLQDKDGNPAKAPQSVTVSLTSSNDTIVTISQNRLPNENVPESLVIQRGNSYAQTTVTAMGKNGTATITAIAPNFDAGSAVVTAETAATKPTKLTIFINPSTLPPDGSSHNAVVLQTQDDAGRPYKPRTGEVTVTLSSSDNTIGIVQKQITFDGENTFMQALFNTGVKAGSTTITASATALPSDPKTVNVQGSVATSLALTQVPSIIQADGRSSDAIAVTVLDQFGNAVLAPKDISVTLSSSFPDVVGVAPVVTIPAGKSFVMVKATTTDQAGQSTISASSQEYGSAIVTFNTVAFNIQYKLGIYIVPKLRPADGETFEAVVIQHQDSVGNPIAATSDIIVTLSSSSQVGGSLDPNVVIKKGSTYAVANFTAPSTDDRTTITASAEGYESVNAILESSLQPLTLSIPKIPRAVTLSGLPLEVNVFFKNIPVKGASVQVTGTHADVTTAITDENGHARVMYIPTAPGGNTISVTASKKGYSSAASEIGILISQLVNITVKAVTDAGKEINGTRIAITPEAGGAITQETQPGTPVMLNGVSSGIYSVFVPKEIRTGDGVYKFERWSDGVTDDPRNTNVAYDSDLTATYTAYFLLKASSPYGIVAGANWYPEGSTAALSIQPTTVSEMLIDRSFTGWSGDINSDVPTVKVVMDSPKTVTAKWSESYVKLIGIVSGGVGAAGFLVYKKVKVRGFRKKSKPPDLDWFKSE